MSSKLHSIPAHPRGIWEKERGWGEGDRGSDRWILRDTWEIVVDFPLTLCQFMSFWLSLYLPVIISSVDSLSFFFPFKFLSFSISVRLSFPPQLLLVSDLSSVPDLEGHPFQY